MQNQGNEYDNLFYTILVDEQWYINNYHDLREAHVAALDHYRSHGRHEGRLPRKMASDLINLPFDPNLLSVSASDYYSYILEWRYLRGFWGEAEKIVDAELTLNARGSIVSCMILLRRNDIINAVNQLRATTKRFPALTNFYEYKTVLADFASVIKTSPQSEELEEIIYAHLMPRAAAEAHAKVKAFQILRESGTNVAGVTGDICERIILSSQVKRDVGRTYALISRMILLDFKLDGEKLVEAVLSTFSISRSTEPEDLIAQLVKAKLVLSLADSSDKTELALYNQLTNLILKSNNYDLKKTYIKHLLADRESSSIKTLAVATLIADATLTGSSLPINADYIFDVLENEVFKLGPECVHLGCVDLVAKLRSAAHILDSKQNARAAIVLFRIVIALDPIASIDTIDYADNVARFYLKQRFEAGDIDNDQISKLARGLPLRHLPLLSTNEFSKQFGGPYTVTQDPIDIVVPSLAFCGSYPRLTSELGAPKSLEVYASLISDCTVFPRSNIIISRGHVICDIARVTTSKEIVLGGSAEDGAPYILAHNQNSIILEHIEESSRVRPLGISLIGVQSANWGHWLAEYLPRMLAFNETEATRGLPIYIDAGLPQAAKDALRLLDEHHRDVIEVDHAKAVRFEGLWVSNTVSFFPFDFSDGPELDALWPPTPFSRMANIIKEKLKGRGVLGSSKRRRLYISRANYNTRNISNEEEVRTFLEGLGFETIFPELMTFEEQVAMFDSATIIVGTCNSALQNCIFCRSGTEVIGLIHGYTGFNFNAYASFVSASGASLKFLRGATIEEKGMANFHKKFAIDLDVLSQALADSEEKIFDQAVTACANTRSDELELLLGSSLFDDKFYEANFASKSADRVKMISHFLHFGSYEQLNPSIFFQTSFYIQNHQDVANADVNPLVHYLKWGVVEGRLPIDFSIMEDHWFSVDRVADHGSKIIESMFLAYQVYKGRVLSGLDLVAADLGVPGRIQMVMGSIYTLMHEGEYGIALSSLRVLNDVFPNDANINYQSGVACRALGKLSLAMRYMERATNLSSEDFYVSELSVVREHVEADVDLFPDTKPHEGGLAFFDTSFPDPISSFRFGEFSAYLTEFPNSKVYSSNWDVQRYGGQKSFKKLVEDRRLDTDSVDQKRIVAFDSRTVPKGSNVYCVFLNNALVVRNSETFAPSKFGFTLYPGGGFELNSPLSLKKMRKVFDDKRFGFVISTQNITEKFLIENELCDPSQIVSIFGGVVPFIQNRSSMPQYVRKDISGNLKVCFVAQRYSAYGREKGFDVFIEVANIFAKQKGIEFHVVGGFDRDVLPIRDGANITFHGVKPSAFFGAFYAEMDAILSPNVSTFELTGSGSFDGFPLTSCIEAGSRGVSMMLCDSLRQNRINGEGSVFTPGVHFLEIDRRSKEIAEMLRHYLEARDDLRQIGESGRRKLIDVYSYANQIEERAATIRRFFKGS